MNEIDESRRWSDLDKLLTRAGNVVGPGFEPGPELREFLQHECRILCIGAGGLGCECVAERTRRSERIKWNQTWNGLTFLSDRSADRGHEQALEGLGTDWLHSHRRN